MHSGCHCRGGFGIGYKEVRELTSPLRRIYARKFGQNRLTYAFRLKIRGRRGMRYRDWPAQNQGLSNRKLRFFKWIAATTAILLGVPGYAMQNPAGAAGKSAGSQTTTRSAQRTNRAPAKKRPPAYGTQEDQKSGMEDFQKLMPVFQELG